MLSLIAGIVGIATTKGISFSGDESNNRVPFVNVANDGDFIQCNTNPSYFISDLKYSDRIKVNELEFVQGIFRHGVRILQTAPYDFFPEYAQKNPDWRIKCNVTQLDGREYIDSTNNVKFRKNYIKNEQWYKGSDCAYEQSLYGTIHEMEATSDIFKERYFGNKYKYKTFSKNDLKSSNLEIYSTDMTRTIDSAMYFTQHLLSDELNNKPSTIDLTIHDLINEPFRMDVNRDCDEAPQWNQWTERFEEAVHNKEALEDFENSDFAQDLRRRYKKAGGVWIPSHPLSSPFRLSYHYCAGLDIPLPLDLWKDMEKYDKLYQKAYDDSKYGEEMNYCYNHIRMIPAYQVTLNAINQMKNKNGPKALLISSHALSMDKYLWGLNIYDNSFEPFGGLVTLEIYSANKDCNDDNIEYLFRWTYPSCNDYYKRENTELCDLQIMLDQDFKDTVPINEFNKNVCPKAVDLCLCGLCD